MAQPAVDAKFQVDIPAEMLEAMTGGGSIAQRVTRAEALQVPAVQRARNLIAGTLGSLPHHVHDPKRREVPSTYLMNGNIDPDIPNTVVLAQTYEDLLFESMSWWRVTQTGWHNYPIHARHIPIEAVHVAPVGWVPSEGWVSADWMIPEDGQIFIDGIPVDDSEVIRFDSPNPPLLRHAARAIRSALQLDKTAALYAKEPLPLGYFAPREGVDPGDDEEIQEILDNWEIARSQRAWGYIGAALEGKTLQWSPEQLQLAATRQHAVLEIARAAGIDPEDLGVSTTSRTYQNGVDRRLDMIDFTLAPYAAAVQDRLSMRDLLPRGYSVHVDYTGFTRADFKGRMEGWEIATRIGVYTTEEARASEGRPVDVTPESTAAELPSMSDSESLDHSGATFSDDPKKPYGDVSYADPGYQEDGKKRYPIDTEEHCRAAWSYINQSDNAAKYSSDELSKIKARIMAAGKKYGIEFEEGSESSSSATVEFDLPMVDAAFRVNTGQRQITGLAVPWGEVARSGFVKYRFAQDALEWATSRRVKLLIEHDASQAVGKAIELTSKPDGLWATFSVARGPEGDRALSLAEDGVLDGLSVGVAFIDGYFPKPDPQDGSVQFVQRAILREISLTPMPSFDGARVTDVAASRSNERTPTVAPTVTDTKLDQDDDAQFDLTEYLKLSVDGMTKAHQELTAELSTSIGDSIVAGLKTAMENLPMPQDGGPQRVRAARFKVTREAPIYTFTSGGESLVRDAYYAATQQDTNALGRLRKYREQTEEVATLAAQRMAQFATSTTTTDPEIIPPGYRPDLYVPQLAKERPLVSSCSRGSIQNASPFTVPIFTSITTGSADHVEGTNPTDGTLAFGTSTVSPGAISGLLKLSREIVDSSNPSIDAIALQAMRESYSQQTEAKVYTLLNGTSGAGGVITGDLVPSGAQAVTVAGGTDNQTLVKMIRERLAKYPFLRFAAPSQGHMGQGATVRLATAVDTTQRPLFPSIGASNANGVGNAITQGWNVDGLAFVPAWAMTGVAAGDSQIMFFNSTDVWVWESPLLSFRYEERSGPALIELAMFGYFGTHLLRPVGLSGIRIT